MAVVAINSGNFSNTSNTSTTFYTCPAGRSARVEVFHATNGTFTNSEPEKIGITCGSGIARAYVQYESGTITPRTVLGNSPAGASGGTSNSRIAFLNSNSTSTIYVPASGTLKAQGMAGTFVAIEEDDG